MNINYYLSLIPESLIASMLTPTEFGSYYAIGSQKRSRGQAIFFSVDVDKAGGAIDVGKAEELCVPHPDGSPRNSSYLSIYQALESVPIAALERLYLTTEDGRTLGLDSAEYVAEEDRPLHLYQELCPVTPRVVSKLSPPEFAKRLTAPGETVFVPRIVFAEMKLEQLAIDPDSKEVNNLPYINLEHLRDCLKELGGQPAKPTKAVIRQMKQDFLYRTIRGGFFVGDQVDFKFFPMPSLQELETEHYAWWRSAQSSFGG